MDERGTPSPRLQRLFGRYARRYLRKHLHALRVHVPDLPAIDPGTPLIVYLNHASWWDPLVASIIACEFFPDRIHYAPMAPSGLKKYRFLSRLGFFGVEPNTLGGARTFLRTATAVCSEPATALWLTPQGRFTDPRERPVRLESGLPHLLCRLPRALVLPLALEDPFWEERTPEALALAGLPVHAGGSGSLTAEPWRARLRERLESAQDELAKLACARDTRRLRTLVRGRAGVGGIYDLWRAVRSWGRGEAFRRAHGSGS